MPLHGDDEHYFKGPHHHSSSPCALKLVLSFSFLYLPLLFPLHAPSKYSSSSPCALKAVLRFFPLSLPLLFPFHAPSKLSSAFFFPFSPAAFLSLTQSLGLRAMWMLSTCVCVCERERESERVRERERKRNKERGTEGRKEGGSRLVRLQWFCPSFLLTHRT